MIGNLFLKDIHRNIEGVIKADNLSDDAIYLEVDEYVITKELKSKLDDFFEEYSSTIERGTQNIGVWISGHFGSGKSHLLKILSYILTNERKHSDLIGELFLSKIKNDVELQQNIQKALKTPSQTILFNIDQKSDISSKKQEDAILSVFMKVFNEMRGYYPKFGYIAKFESDLDKRGKLQVFKEKFEEVSGSPWEQGREAILLEGDSLATALAMVDNISEESATDLIKKYDKNYSLSIEEFAQEVKAYIDTKEPNFRLVFCVDEVGQYIGENTKLMLNLQTIVETLSTVCRGQAWVIVTSQSAVDMLVNANSAMENDFSKIMGRFRVKLNLTSQNANEVVQKRLLEKNQQGQQELNGIYGGIQNSLSSIIHFSDRSRQYRSYKNSQEFVLVYPFVPYQMDLFQSSISGLSTHSVFQGKHQSTGERSMLDVVQEISKKLSKKEIGSIATYDMFFDGVSSIIRGDVQTPIKKSKDILKPLEFKLLKVLFMVKYVKEFSANIDNLTTLMVDNLSSQLNIPQLKKEIHHALNRLIDQFYIQKNGEQYEFLTDAEKDIEKEISATEIENREIMSRLVGWVYDDVIRIQKVRYTPNKQFYPFARKIDDALLKGREEELVLNIITPLNSQDYTHDRLLHKSIGDEGLILALPNSLEFLQELELFVKTEKYIPQKQGGSLSENEKNILFNKTNSNNRRREQLQQELKRFISEADIYFNGHTLQINNSDIKAKIENAFEKLISTTYPSIHLLSQVYEERDIHKALEDVDNLLSGSEDALTSAEKEIFIYIERQKKSHKTVTISELLAQFQRRPYGWYQNAILTLVASLYKKQKVDFRKNSTSLGSDEILTTLTKNREFHTVVSPRVLIDSKQLKKSKNILSELFPESRFTSTSSQEIFTETQQATHALIEKCQNYKNLKYPFSDAFDEIIDALTPLQQLTVDNLFEEIPKMEDMLLDTKDDLIDPIMEFMNGEKRKIYDEIVNFLRDNSNNLRYIETPQKSLLESLVTSTQPYRDQNIPKAKQALATVITALEPLIAKAREEAIAKIGMLITELQSDENFEKIPTANRYKVIRPRQNLIESIQKSSSIDTIKQISSEESLSRELDLGIESIYDLIPKEEQVSPKQTTVQLSTLLPKERRTLNNQEEIEQYLQSLKTALLAEIEKGNQIRL